MLKSFVVVSLEVKFTLEFQKLTMSLVLSCLDNTIIGLWLATIEQQKKLYGCDSYIVVHNLQVQLSVSTKGPKLHMPPPYSIVIQV